MKILFLEDEPTIREVLTEYMKMQNYEVTCAEDGEKALKLLGQEAFDMAVLDIMVPKVSGLEVLSFIKENKPETATIMLTALDDEKTQVQAFNSYADDYVIKPVSPIILLKRMETILRRVKKGEQKEEKGLVIHGDSYQAFYDGKPLELTLSEFLLLQVLEKEKNRAFTREQLGIDDMKLSKKTFLYSIILAAGMVALVIIYFVLMLPSLYVDYVMDSNLQSVVDIQEGYMEKGNYEGLEVKNPSAVYTVEIPMEGEQVYITGSFPHDDERRRKFRANARGSGDGGK